MNPSVESTRGSRTIGLDTKILEKDDLATAKNGFPSKAHLHLYICTRRFHGYSVEFSLSIPLRLALKSIHCFISICQQSTHWGRPQKNIRSL